MRLAIMQPYFLPYIGYWQLMGAVDAFVVYDRIKYTKKGWINRNRMLLNGDAATFSLPLAQGSDQLLVSERELAPSFDRRKLIAQFEGTYRKAPQFDALRPWLQDIVLDPANNLFDYLWQSIVKVRDRLGLTTRLIVSSEVPHDESLRAQDKVLAICKALGATTYVNAIGGMELYEREAFAARGVELLFHKARPFEYAQFGAPFVPWLSIVDVLMFNSAEQTHGFLTKNYELS
ncbi:hypothetical protein J2X20_004543 [Pelomonas saccharophila]|uniref:WbqC-like protein n=1 Tax=Roseateles saccharophilus TaxID=304 RepID=A0ABU1YSN8_ROSSA|nr:WbqC family protein [Roseateles saccharophilus]MDR7271875.1 hypothetical protein [Roseateles saccharophilus]